MFDERFQIMIRAKWHKSIEEMRIDLDQFLHHYNH
ncbi:MAG: hypothetical protein LBT38_09925 [Deltaproteobacteria bacterium]|nr:hypothetical protein [Deltaproteobacteria bacterium]